MTERSFNVSIRMIQLKINYAYRMIQLPTKLSNQRMKFWNDRIKDLQSEFVNVVNNYNEGGCNV